MKKLLFLFVFCTLTVQIFAKIPKTSLIITQEQIKPFKKYHLVGTFTTPQGCTYSYDLYLDVSLIPPRFNSLTGTMTTSGNCTGTQTINITSLRGLVKNDTKETSYFGINESVFQDQILQDQFEKVLQEHINNEKDLIWK